MVMWDSACIVLQSLFAYFVCHCHPYIFLISMKSFFFVCIGIGAASAVRKTIEEEKEERRNDGSDSCCPHSFSICMTA